MKRVNILRLILWKSAGFPLDDIDEGIVADALAELDALEQKINAERLNKEPNMTLPSRDSELLKLAIHHVPLGYKTALTILKAYQEGRLVEQETCIMCGSRMIQVCYKCREREMMGPERSKKS